MKLSIAGPPSHDSAFAVFALSSVAIASPRRPHRCTVGGPAPGRGQPGFRPGAGGLFWNAAQGPAGGPCDIFGLSGAESFGGGTGGFHGGSLSNPNSFSFFSAGVEYGQRRTRAEQHKPAFHEIGRSIVRKPADGISVSSLGSFGSSFTPLTPSSFRDSTLWAHQLPKACGDTGTAPLPPARSPAEPLCSPVATAAPIPTVGSQGNANPRASHSPSASFARPPTAATFAGSAPSSRTPPSSPASSASSSPTRKQTPERRPRQEQPQQGQSQHNGNGSGRHHTNSNNRSGPSTQNSQGHSHVSGKVRRQVRALFERAKEEERAGGIDETRRLLRQCLTLDRRDAHSWLALARLEARCGGVSLKPNSSPNSPASPLSVPMAEPESFSLELSEAPGSSRSDVAVSGAIGSASASISSAPPKNSGVELARSLFQEGVCECPNSVHLLQAWAVLEHRCGDRDAARALFARGLELEPDNPYVCQAWGLLEQRGGNTEAARSLFRRSVSLSPHPEVCAAWAVLEAREGNVRRSRELFECGLKACKSSETPSAAAIYRSWAEIEERVGDLVGARELLSKAVTSQPRVAEAYVALARLEARRGYRTRALELMQTAAGLSKKPPALVFNAWAQVEWTSCGRIEAAREILERGHSLHPMDPALLQTLGTLEERCGNVARAKELFAASIRIRPTAPAFVAWALVEEKEGNKVETVNLFEQALLTDALHGAAYNAYGMMEARRGELDRARAVYERGLKVYASASVWHGYGQLELKLGRNPDRARELFQCGVAQTREDTAFIWHSWGMLELSRRSPLEARRVFLDALKRYPRNSRVLVGAALAHAAAYTNAPSDEHAARDYFKRAVAADPAHAHAWQTWGVFELRRGRRDAADALFRRGLRLCPTHGALWQAWGVLETANGNFERARQLFARGAAACPSHVHLYQAWACMEVRSGNVDRARELLDHALESDPCHGPVWNAYGLLEARHGTLAKARQNFLTGITRAPNHAPLYRTYGQTEARLGNYDRAREMFREGLKRDPWHAPLYHALAEFEAMIGNIGALAELKTEAEKYFGSEADATRAIHDGQENLDTDVGDTSDDGVEYASVVTPMELALDCTTTDSPP
jgi:tetratricopeptide (TPR) repeat protein